MHVNPRHHTVALIETGKQDLHHLMVELYSLDDVGQGYDIVLGQPEMIMTTLGRHPNDTVMSYYLGSRLHAGIRLGRPDRDTLSATTRQTEVTVGPSLWGHDRAWLPEDQREKARAMKLKAAAGWTKREPVRVIDGNFCADGRRHRASIWWDEVKGQV